MISYVKSLVFEGCVTVHQDWHLKRSEMMECSVCHKKENSKSRCVNGHYVCNDCHTAGLDSALLEMMNRGRAFREEPAVSGEHVGLASVQGCLYLSSPDPRRLHGNLLHYPIR